MVISVFGAKHDPISSNTKPELIIIIHAFHECSSTVTDESNSEVCGLTKKKRKKKVCGPLSCNGQSLSFVRISLLARFNHLKF